MIFNKVLSLVGFCCSLHVLLVMGKSVNFQSQSASRESNLLVADRSNSEGDTSLPDVSDDSYYYYDEQKPESPTVNKEFDSSLATNATALPVNVTAEDEVPCPDDDELCARIQFEEKLSTLTSEADIKRLYEKFYLEKFKRDLIRKLGIQVSDSGESRAIAMNIPPAVLEELTHPRRLIERVFMSKQVSCRGKHHTSCFAFDIGSTLGQAQFEYMALAEIIVQRPILPRNKLPKRNSLDNGTTHRYSLELKHRLGAHVNIAHAAHASDEEFLKFQLEKVDVKLLMDAEDFYGLYVHCKTCRPKIQAAEVTTFGEYRPFLRMDTIAVEEHVIERRKRSARSPPIPPPPRKCSSTVTECCLETFNVTLQDLNLKSEIQNFHTAALGYCKGSCSAVLSESNRPEYTRRVASLHLERRPADHKFCCHPTRYDPLTMLVSERGGIYQSYILHDMIIRDCGCS